jgi:putative oxidoreductase
MVLVMVVATITVHWPHGFYSTSNGFELPMAYASIAVLLAFMGFGAYSLDAVLGTTSLSTERNAVIAIVAGIVLGILTALMRRPPAKSAAA